MLKIFIVFAALILDGVVSPAGLPEPESESSASVDFCFEGGALHMKVSTRSQWAQRAFDKGLVFLHSFVWHKAEHCLRRSLELDANLAVAHVELARVFLGQEMYPTARHHAYEAKRLVEHVPLPPREKAWVLLGCQQVEAATAPTHLAREQHERYKLAIEAYIADFPEDPFGFILRGNAEGPRAGGRGQTGGEASIAWYQRALAIEPENLAAQHFLAHSYENSGRYEEALEHARHFAAGASQIPHAQHMLAHVLPRLGRWTAALEILEKAHALHHESFGDEIVQPEEDWHFGHNLRLLAVVHWRLGHEKKAEELLTKLYEVDYDDHRSGYYCLPLGQFLLLRARFEDTLRLADTCRLRPSLTAKVLSETLSGEALLGLGKVDEARRSFDQAALTFHELISAIDPRSEEGIFVYEAGMALNILGGKLALHEGDTGGHAQLLRLARQLGGGKHFDAWAAGTMRLEELARYAHKAGHLETRRLLQEQLRILDPTYELSF